jgi:hypothetical protein
MAVGLLCATSFAPVHPKDLQDLFSILLIILLGATPFFAMGTMTERDRLLFLKRPLIESFHPAKLLINYPPTGPFYLMILLFLFSTLIGLCTGLPMNICWGYYATLLLWVFPWTIAFVALRLMFSKPQALFIIYGIGTLLYSIFAIFRSAGRTLTSIFDFYTALPDILFFAGATVVFYAVARTWARNKKVADPQVGQART